MAGRISSCDVGGVAENKVFDHSLKRCLANRKIKHIFHAFMKSEANVGIYYDPPRKKNYCKVLTSVLLLFVFAFYFSSINFFSHTHEVDGRQVSHSHPFAQDNHSHSGDSVFTIKFLAKFVSVNVLLLILSHLFVTIRFIYNIVVLPQGYDSDFGVILLRAPPAGLI